jgi:anti-sigma B factor antagonist
MSGKKEIAAMKVKEKVSEGIAVLSISGKMMGGPDQAVLHDRVRDLISDNIHWVVMDLGKVEWLNSSGLGLLMGCLASCRGAGGDMVVARADRRVNSIFMLTQVIKVFETYETNEEALAALKEKQIG